MNAIISTVKLQNNLKIVFLNCCFTIYDLFNYNSVFLQLNVLSFRMFFETTKNFGSILSTSDDGFEKVRIEFNLYLYPATFEANGILFYNTNLVKRRATINGSGCVYLCFNRLYRMTL